MVLQRDTPTAADTALRREVLARMGQLVSHGVLGFQVLSLLPLCPRLQSVARHTTRVSSAEAHVPSVLLAAVHVDRVQLC